MPKSIKFFMSSFLMLFILGWLLLGIAFSESMYDRHSLSSINAIKNSIGDRFPFIWPGPDYSAWAGLQWDDSSPRRLMAIQFPLVPIDAVQGSIFDKPVRIEGLPGLKQIAITNLGSNSELLRDHANYLVILNNLPDLTELGLSAQHNYENLVDLESLAALPKLKTLNLSGNGTDPGEYKALSNLAHIESVTLTGSTIDDLGYFKDLKTLKHLSLVDTGHHLDDYSYTSQKVYWRSREIPLKIANLDNLRLESLNLSRNLIVEIEGLGSQVSLRKLNLSKNRIKEIKGLESLNQLEDLILHENSISIINNLDKLANLERLDLNNNRITEIDGLDKLHKLRELKLRGNPFKEIKNLGSLSNLRSLEVDKIDQITGLEALHLLERLVIHGKSGAKKDRPGALSTLSGLENNVALKHLDLYMNTIQSLDGLKPLKNLVSLNLAFNNLSGLMSMPALEELTTLDLTANSLTNISGLEKLPRLENLNLSGNRGLKDFALLESSPYLTQLDISGMDYGEAPPLKITTLKSLSLSNNLLSRLPVLSDLPRLENLYISSNRLQEISISDLPSGLKKLDISRNGLITTLKIKTPATLEWLKASNCNLQPQFDFSGFTNLHFADLSNNRLKKVVGWDSLPDKAIINVSGNSLPLSLLHRLMLDSKEHGRQWRLGKKQQDVFGDLELQSGEVIDLSQELEINGEKTQIKVSRLRGGRSSTTTYMTDGYERWEKNKNVSNEGRNIAASKKDIEPGHCQPVENGIRFTKPGLYRIHMYNDSIVYHQPTSSTLHRENVVEVGTGVILVK